jgi:hypothetical protein
MPQALILARRFSAASAELGSLRPGAGRDYLQAEATWRQGDLCSAISFLQSRPHSGTPAGTEGDSCSHGSTHACAGTCKLARLLQQLHLLADRLQSAEEALDDGEHLW